MKRIAKNQLLLSTLVTLVTYCVAGVLLPLPYLSSTTSLLLLLCGGFVLYRYVPFAWTILLRKDNADDPSELGGHYAVYGTTLLALGSCYVGIFGLLWVWFEQPADWLGTPLSGFGRAVMASGFFLMFVSPDVAIKKRPVLNPIWTILLVALALLAAFALGSQLRPI